MLSAVVLIGSSVFSVGSVVSISRVFCFSRVEGFVFLSWICVSPVADASRVNIPGSLVVVLVLTSVFLVKISD